MEQLSQKLKNGKIKVIEAPLPSVGRGTVLVRNYFSAVSAGTEGSTVKAARKNLIGKVKARPQQAKQVVETLKTQGPVKTYRAVMKKLDVYSPLGYSSVGEVIDMSADVKGFAIGELVACGGKTAAHAEVVSVLANLCVKLTAGTDLRQAAYNTLGAIAMQGVRQADLRLGETCAVIGLGLLGQITGLLLKASGIRVIGIDIDSAMVEIAAKNCFDVAINREAGGIENRILEITEGLGCDAIIITAAADSLDPINFAGVIARKKGNIVVVGDVPTGFDREPHYYKKELQIKMSCSYGPGRYDPIYEDHGIDYPAAYVRWTEKRNMAAFQDLIYTKKIDLNYLTTHTFKLEDAPQAYDMMTSRSELFIGMLIEYDATKEIALKRSRFEIRPPSRPASQLTSVSIGVIGAGSYAQSHLLPNIPKGKDVSLKGVLTSSGMGSRSAAERFGFEFCTGNQKDILKNEEINTVFIATHHDSHADYVIKALKSGKNVFVEKPLCLKEEELNQIVKLLSNRADENSLSTLRPQITIPILMVGYNRRFSPFAKIIKAKFGEGPMATAYRVNAGAIPPESWIQDTGIGGGRIIGEVCHFIDFLTFINGSLPKAVYACVMSDPNQLNDTLIVSLNYKNASIGTISFFSNGDKSLPKERIEVYAGGCTAIIEDFKALTIHTGGKKTTKKLLSQDKGQKNEVKAFIDAIIKSSKLPIPYDEIHSTSLVAFKILESIRTGRAMLL